MKYRIIVFIALAVWFLFGTGHSIAFGQQDNIKREQLKAKLSPEQIAILETNRASISETRRAFKASLTREQIEMLENSNLTIEQRRANLKASLTAQQQQAINENRRIHQAQKQAFRNSLTVQQKQNMKKAYIQKKGKFNASPGLRRSKRIR